MLAAITLLPAVISAVGPPHRLAPRSRRSSGRSRSRPTRGFWGAWGRWVTTHPWSAVGITFLILGILLIPFFSLNLGQEDIGATPKSTTERQAYDYLKQGFGPGYTSPLLVAVKLPTPAKPSSTFDKQYKRAQDLQSQLEDEQATGQAQAASLEAQGNALVAEKGRLEAEKTSLQNQGKRPQGAEVDPREERQEAQAAEQADRPGTGSDRPRPAARRPGGRPVGSGPAARRGDQAEPDAGADPAAQGGEPAAQGGQDGGRTSSRAELAHLKAEASKAGGQAFAIASQAASTAEEAVGLVQAKNQLTLEAADAQVTAAELQTQQVQLEALQQQAETQQQQAEKLKSTLTADLTAAGGDKRGTDPRLVNLQNALEGTMGVQVVSPPAINKSGQAAIFNVVSTTDPADRQTATSSRPSGAT